MIRIGDWCVTPETCTLRRHQARDQEGKQESKRLPPRAMDVLIYLARHAGEVVSTEDLLSQFWPSASATDHAVHKVLATLRQALGDSRQSPSYIRTYPKRGYALIARVDFDAAEDSTADAVTDTGPPTREKAHNRSGFWLENRTRFLATGTAALIIAAGLLLAGITKSLWQNSEDDTQVATQYITIDPVEYIGTEVDPANTYLATGIKAALTANLAKLPRVRVVSDSPLNKEYQLHTDPEDRIEAGCRLRTQFIDLGDKINLNVELVNNDSGQTLYSDNYELAQTDLLAIQDKIVDNVANSLRIVLDKQQSKAMHDWGTGDALAYDHFIKAEFYKRQWNHSDWELAIEHYREAIEIDPRFVNAYTGLATAANYMSVYSKQKRSDELTRLLTEYERKLEMLMPDIPAVELLKSMVLNTEGVRHAMLEKRYRRQILSGNAPAYVFAQYGLMLQGARLYDEARQFLNLAASDDAYKADPNQQSNFLTGVLTPWEAIDVKKQQLIDQPRHIGMLGTLVSSLALNGNFTEARYYLERQAAADKDGIRAHLSKIYVSAATGELDDQYHRTQPPLQKLGAGPGFEFPELFKASNLNNPDLQFNNGVMALVVGDIEAAAKHWHNMTASDKRKLVTRLHTSEIFFPVAILSDQDYELLLEELDVGPGWQQQLMQGVLELEPVTGIGLNEVSRHHLDGNRFMPKNNLWTKDDWALLEGLKAATPDSGTDRVKSKTERLIEGG